MEENEERERGHCELSKVLRVLGNGKEEEKCGESIRSLATIFLILITLIPVYMGSLILWKGKI